MQLRTEQTVELDLIVVQLSVSQNGMSNPKMSNVYPKMSKVISIE